eukprot:1160101-Pelagomonas_calceolata.AAC.7
MSSQKESSENIQWLVRYRNSAILLREIQYKGCPKGCQHITQLSQTVKLATLLQKRRAGGAEAAAGSAATTPALTPVPVPAELDEPPTAEEVNEYASSMGHSKVVLEAIAEGVPYPMQSDKGFKNGWHKGSEDGTYDSAEGMHEYGSQGLGDRVLLGRHI